MGLTKEQFDRLYVGKGLAVNCDTEEKANEFLKLADSFGYMWINGDSFLNRNYWNDYKEDMCYYVYNGQKCYKRFYINDNCKIVSYPQHAIQFTKSDLKSGDKTVYRNGTERYVLIEIDMLITNDGSIGSLLSNFNKNLKNTGIFGEEFDVIKVYRNNELIWERVEESAKTPQQIELEKIEIRQRELAEEQKKLADRIKELSK